MGRASNKIRLFLSLFLLSSSHFAFSEDLPKGALPCQTHFHEQATFRLVEQFSAAEVEEAIQAGGSYWAQKSEILDVRNPEEIYSYFAAGSLFKKYLPNIEVVLDVWQWLNPTKRKVRPELEAKKGLFTSQLSTLHEDLVSAGLEKFLSKGSKVAAYPFEVSLWAAYVYFQAKRSGSLIEIKPYVVNNRAPVSARDLITALLVPAGMSWKYSDQLKEVKAWRRGDQSSLFNPIAGQKVLLWNRLIRLYLEKSDSFFPELKTAVKTGFSAEETLALLQACMQVRTPEPEKVVRQLLLLKSVLPAEVYQAFGRSITPQILSKAESFSPKIRDWFSREFHEVRNAFEKEVIKNVAGPSLDLSASLQFKINHSQDSLNQTILSILENCLQANAPPDFLKGLPKPWGRLVEQIPAQYRFDFVKKLLTKNEKSAGFVAEIISQLEPSDGTRQAVVGFLVHSRLVTTSNRTEFSQEQIVKMFSADRLEKFFPWAAQFTWNGATRTQFVVMLKTSPLSAGINLEWLRGKIDSNDTSSGVHFGLGFRPIRRYANLNAQLSSGLSDEDYTSSSQLRGLIVQGGYEKLGYSLLEKLEERGTESVEVDAVQIASKMDSAYEMPLLKNEEPIVQRWFSDIWNLNASGSQIRSIRRLAIDVAEANGNFWNLRVEIHNFPTIDTLRRVEAWKAARSSQLSGAAQKKLNALITEIRSLHRVNGISNFRPLEWIKDKKFSSQQSELVLPVLQSAGELSDQDRFIGLVEVRKKLRSEKLKKRNFYLVDRYLSEEALKSGYESIRTVSAWSSDRVVSVALAVIQHLVLDDLLTEEQFQNLSSEMHKIVSNTGFSENEKKNDLLRQLSNTIDQCYFRFFHEFGDFDFRFNRLLNAKEHFVDSSLRSSNAMLLSELSDRLGAEINQAQNIQHSIFHKKVSSGVEVYNAGKSQGVLRLNPDPMLVKENEIAVFQTLPSEAAPLAGILTVGSGARLSHLQLLAKALHVPNARVSPEVYEQLKAYEGKNVELSAAKDGTLKLQEVALVQEAEEASGTLAEKTKIEIPEPDYSVIEPVSFDEVAALGKKSIAGPKGMTLVKLRASPALRSKVPDGMILPFGFFNDYAEKTGISKWLSLLSQIENKYPHLVSVIAGKIRFALLEKPIPNELLEKVMAQVTSLEGRTGANGFFVRSDTNVEDLPGFNGAGLNESVPNVALNAQKMEQAIRAVWVSAFKEKSILWRSRAVGESRVTLGIPSVVIMPTVEALSSGVMISRGGKNWEKGKGWISANHGIGSVVEASIPVEEITLEGGTPIRLGWSAARKKPVSDRNGLKLVDIAQATEVLTAEEIQKLNADAGVVESVLGDEPQGWDIEWVIDSQGEVKIVQARPNR